jgi:serine/threonine protein kinase, bacterial
MTIYQLTDRPHRGRTVHAPGDQIVATAPAWLAELGAHSPSVEDLAPAVGAGNGRSSLFADVSPRRASSAWWAVRDCISHTETVAAHRLSSSGIPLPGHAGHRSPMPLASGTQCAGYTILRLLGSGGMGQVYLAQHPRLPRRDALKVLPHDVCGDPEFRERFNREADLASTLWHPHIVGVHDRGEADGQLWIAMDFVDGLDAARLLAERYPAGMPLDQVLRIAAAVAGALDYAHKQGLLHRDVKPANIMNTHVDDDGEQRILLADFGIARNIDDISGLTETNMSVGTVAYCAPEQLMGQDIDGRADQYALAATVYHLLTGSHPFPHSNPAVVISRHLNATPPALADTHPELAALDPVLAAALAKNPDNRFRRCSDFARALAEQANANPSALPAACTIPAPIPRKPAAATRCSPPASAPHAPTTGRASRGRWLMPIAAGAAIVLLGAAALIWRPLDDGQSTSTQGSSSAAPVSTALTSTIPAAPPAPQLPPPRPVFPASAIVAQV